MTANPPSGSVGSSAFTITADNGIVGPDHQTFTLTVHKRTAVLVYGGATSGTYSDPATLSATLTDSVTGTPVPGAVVTFTVGTQSVSATTSTPAPSGIAAASLTLTQQPGVVTFSASWPGSGDYDAVSTIAPTTFTIAKESATIITSASNPHALAIARTGAASAFRLSATVRETPDGSLGDITKVTAVVFSLNAVGGAAKPGCTATGTRLSLNASTGVITATCVVAAGTPINVYDVTVAIPGSAYYTGSFHDGLVVSNPSATGASGGGTITGASLPANTRAAFGFLVRSGHVGKFIYVLTTYGAHGLPVSQSIFRGTSISSLVIGKRSLPYAATVTGTGALNGVAGYVFRFGAADARNSTGTGDRFGRLSVTARAGMPAAPAGMHIATLTTIATGNVNVR
jgi:hypothetical protein